MSLKTLFKNQKRWKVNTLRSFITLAVSLTVAVSLLGSGIFFYVKSANTLSNTYKKDIIRQLQQINTQVEDQIHIIDSVYPLFMSNTLIREYLDPASSAYYSKPAMEKRLEIERQMSYLLISTYLWDEKFINSVYIFQPDDSYSKVSLYKDGSHSFNQVRSVYEQISPDSVSLEIKTVGSDDHSIYFARNVKSMYTGSSIATIIIDINQEAWKKAYSENTDENWLICIFNKDMRVLSHENKNTSAAYASIIQAAESSEGVFREIKLDQMYYMASKKLGYGGITSAVAVPKAYLMRELNEVLHTFLYIFVIIIFIALIFTVFLSHAITAPIEKMIVHMKGVAGIVSPSHLSSAECGEDLRGLPPPISMYSEFNDLSAAFQTMLTQLDIYYNDIFQKQLLLKSAEMKALQAQMDPHFLFNVLDTIAWKAQMSGNEEIYQMILSLGELLRSNILSHEKDFVTLEEELAYVRFYIYLQQTRFEDKFSAEIHVDSSLNRCIIPRFCIQPLVENSIVHGLEPKDGFGRLMVNIIDQGDLMEINVADNGIGFSVPPNLSFEASGEENSPGKRAADPRTDTHTHIGLKNLNKRLSLLYGEDCHLTIESIAETCTTISFRIPKNGRGTE